MIKKVNCIMLVDDNSADNYYHERVITKNNAANYVVIKESGLEALEYLESTRAPENPLPDLIFLDINMPGMNGWEFLEEFKKLDKALQSKLIVIMLTTSVNPEDEALAKTYDILADFKTKPLTKEMLEDILTKYYDH
jgi:CheY-like chemotaxis protein